MNFTNVTNYVMFLRYKRSGSALLANLLDAHPNIVFVRNEELFAKWPRWKEQGPERMFDHLYNCTLRYKEKPFSANGYTYPIEGVGYTKEPLVIGHKSSTRRMMELAQDLDKFRAFEEFVGVPLKFVHLVRNPYDMVNARWQQKEFRRKKADLFPIIEHLSEQLAMNRIMRGKAEDYYQIHYEDIVHDTKKEMWALCSFLGVGVSLVHLERCEALVRPVLHAVMPEWKELDKAAVWELIQEYPEFLGRYNEAKYRIV
jgi:hypothetical protein